MNITGLPDDWTSESKSINGDAYTVIKCGGEYGGYVTIDWKRRVFRGGYGTTGRIDSIRSYAGRRWRDELVADAVTWLRAIYEPRRQ